MLYLYILKLQYTHSCSRADFCLCSILNEILCVVHRKEFVSRLSSTM